MISTFKLQTKENGLYYISIKSTSNFNITDLPNWHKRKQASALFKVHKQSSLFGKQPWNASSVQILFRSKTQRTKTSNGTM
jgi:hypothetical protein